MEIGAFTLDEPLPELRNPVALTLLRPWIDVGRAGSLAMETLEQQLDAKSLGRLARPGDFFDFTRYRPVISNIEGERKISVPNSYINWAYGSGDNDFLFLHLLEPHMFAEDYIESVMTILKTTGVSKYCLIGSMYDAVPHTRPLLVTGIAGSGTQQELEEMGVQSNTYEGPTSMLLLISQEIVQYDIQSLGLIIHLPQYVQIEEDYCGQLRLLELLKSLFDFQADLSTAEEKAAEQRKRLDTLTENDSQVKKVVSQLEGYYENITGNVSDKGTPLSQEIEDFLKDINRRFGFN